MTAGQWTIVCEIGATFSRSLLWTIDDEPVDLTGWTARMQVRAEPLDGISDVTAPLAEYSTSLGTITLGDDGTIQILAPPSDVYDVPGRYNHCLELTRTSDSYVVRLVQGPFVCSATCIGDTTT
jgi:hypothetical protein